MNQTIDFISIGKIIVKLIAPKGSVKIVIDRTNWQFGAKNINFFVATIIYGSISIPIACLLLDTRGNSTTQERKRLVEKILCIIAKEEIEIILADREFVGEEWLQYLSQTEGLPFAIRIKKNEKIGHSNGGKMKLGKYFADMEVGTIRSIETRIYSGLAIKITCLQLERESLLVASNILIGEQALVEYKQRWSIERSFKSIKTSGFNIEDTHMTDQGKLWKLFAIVSISLAICVIAGEIKNNICPIKVKKHGRKLYSLFTYGFDWLRDYFCNSQTQTQMLIILFSRLRTKLLLFFQPIL